jgi:hypothetical protein
VFFRFFFFFQIIFLLLRKHRWLQFDRDQYITYFTNPGGLPGFPGGGLAEVLTCLTCSTIWAAESAQLLQLDRAMNAWNDDPGSKVLLRRGDTTNADGGLRSPDSVNSVMLNDTVDAVTFSLTD